MKTILYSNDCPKCKILKSKLDEKKVDYEVCSDLDEMILRGFKTMPILEITNDKENASVIMNYLEAINYIKGIN